MGYLHNRPSLDDNNSPTLPADYAKSLERRISELEKENRELRSRNLYLNEDQKKLRRIIQDARDKLVEGFR